MANKSIEAMRMQPIQERLNKHPKIRLKTKIDFLLSLDFFRLFKKIENAAGKRREQRIQIKRLSIKFFVVRCTKMPIKTQMIKHRGPITDWKIPFRQPLYPTQINKISITRSVMFILCIIRIPQKNFFNVSI